MPIVIDQVEGIVEPEEAAQPNDDRREQQATPPHEIEQEKLRCDLEYLERRRARLSAD